MPQHTTVKWKDGFTDGETNGQECRVQCNECKGTTLHTVRQSVRTRWSDDENDVNGITDNEIITCNGCENISFRVTSSNSEDFNYDERTGKQYYDEHIVLYPPRSKRKPHRVTRFLPFEIHDAYVETHAAIENGLVRLGAVGLRVVLEFVCLHLGAKHRTLEGKIDELVSAGLVTEKYARSLHATRIFGNEYAHKNIRPDAAQLNITLSLIENLLETHFEVPVSTALLRVPRGVDK